MPLCGGLGTCGAGHWLGLLSVSVIAVTWWLRNHQDLAIRHAGQSRRGPPPRLTAVS